MAARSNIHQARSEARRKALQILYQSQITGFSTDEILQRELYVSELGLPCDFTQLLLDGIYEHASDIDAMITSTSENWSLERMPLVDLNILRLATFEMLYLDDVPQSVSINEAVELAKNFGGEDDSSRFVNGVLGRIAVIIEQNSRLGRDKNYLAEQLAAQMEPAAQLEPVPQLEPVSQMEPVPQMDSAAMQQEPAVMQQLAARPAAAVMAEQLA